VVVSRPTQPFRATGSEEALSPAGARQGVPSSRPSRPPLSERLRPTRLDDILGNPRARYELREWATRWQEGHLPARRAAVLSGPPGVGKTTAALALASEFGWTTVEMNASDARNESAVEQVAGRASVSHTLGDTVGEKGPRHALILLDEADCLTGRLTETQRPRAVPPALSEFLRGRYSSIDALNASGDWFPAENRNRSRTGPKYLAPRGMRGGPDFRPLAGISTSGSPPAARSTYRTAVDWVRSLASSGLRVSRWCSPSTTTAP